MNFTPAHWLTIYCLILSMAVCAGSLLLVRSQREKDGTYPEWGFVAAMVAFWSFAASAFCGGKLTYLLAGGS